MNMLGWYIYNADFAVSAPFDEGGKVFIYYGSKDNGLINSTVQQVNNMCVCYMHACVMLWYWIYSEYS